VLYATLAGTLLHKLPLQAERQKVGQEPEYQIGYKARVNQNHSNGTSYITGAVYHKRMSTVALLSGF
jgi:hypothetical protein